MQIFDRRKGLAEKYWSLFFAENLLLVLIIKQIASFHVLKHHVDILFILQHLPHFYDMGVVDKRVDGALAIKC